jgi:hypothetical protein
LVANSSPFRDTGSTDKESLAAAGKHFFHIAHLAHRQDTTYDFDAVVTEIGEVKAGGFTDLQFIAKDGPHWDRTSVDIPGIMDIARTNAEIIAELLPNLESGWTVR